MQVKDFTQTLNKTSAFEDKLVIFYRIIIVNKYNEKTKNSRVHFSLQQIFQFQDINL